MEQPTGTVRGVSPDGKWVVVSSTQQDATVAIPLDGGEPVTIPGFVRLRWSASGKKLFIGVGTKGRSTEGTTYVVPLAPGKILPALPASGFASEAELAKLPGVQIIDALDTAPGPSESYAFSRESVQRNLYRIPVPQ